MENEPDDLDKRREAYPSLWNKRREEYVAQQRREPHEYLAILKEKIIYWRSDPDLKNRDPRLKGFKNLMKYLFKTSYAHTKTRCPKVTNLESAELALQELERLIIERCEPLKDGERLDFKSKIERGH